MKKQNKKNLYECKICNFKYKEKEWASKCFNWCSKHNSCNVEITKHSIR